MKVLLVEDERYLAEAVTRILEKNHFDTDLAIDGEEGFIAARSGIYDIILLDIMLPRRDGLAVLRELRAEGVATPVIMLTALGETDDLVKGLDCGADDYLPKPFRTEELMARMRAVLRRRGELLTDGVLSFGDIEYDPNTLILSRGARSFNLTKKEGNLLEYLMMNRGQALSPDAIIEKVWGWDSEAEDNHVQVYISFLRKKLAGLGADSYIKTIRGVGYVLVDGHAQETEE
ncbi:MAG: response regulator transcription factor [Clostridiales Family XIII bacterium]|jgi:DNA-binding response OmpR family regulator|nr:response regulator transcription factor [Clostridiales Family XIII bacterium]